MNPFTNAVIIGIAALLFYVAELPWVAITILGLRTAWWIFYEVVTARERKRQRAHRSSSPTPVSGLKKDNEDLDSSTGSVNEQVEISHLQESSGSPSETANPVFCTQCGTAKTGAGLFCVECGTIFPS